MGAVVPDSRCDANTRPKSERFCNGHILCQRKLIVQLRDFFGKIKVKAVPTITAQCCDH